MTVASEVQEDRRLSNVLERARQAHVEAAENKADSTRRREESDRTAFANVLSRALELDEKIDPSQVETVDVEADETFRAGRMPEITLDLSGGRNITFGYRRQRRTSISSSPELTVKSEWGWRVFESLIGLHHALTRAPQKSVSNSEPAPPPSIGDRLAEIIYEMVDEAVSERTR